MNFFKANSRSLALALSLIGALISQAAVADDTEIFFSEAARGANANVMFIVDASGSMNRVVSGAGGRNRLEVMQSALKTVLETAPTNLNVGLMNFGEISLHNEGHGVKFPITDIQALAEPVVSEKLITMSTGKDWWNSSIPEPPADMTVRDYLSEITSWYWRHDWYTERMCGSVSVEIGGSTPIVDALYEAALYFRGEKVSFGLGEVGYQNRWAAHQSTYEGDPITWEADACEATVKSKSHRYPINFNSGDYSWYKCPADASNPQSPGSYNHCKRTEACRRGGRRCTYDICNGAPSAKPNYKTPITQSCQSNFIVLLSDGSPYIRRDAVSTTYAGLKSGRFEPLVDKANASNKFTHDDCDVNNPPNGYRGGVCGPQLTQFLSRADNNSDLDGVQGIETYTIGFGLSGNASKYLESLVTTDDPTTPEIEGYFLAQDEDQLSQAFSSILDKISSTTSSGASPGYAVDSRTGLFNENDIYVPVFDKALSPRWNGNLKKFKIGTDGAGNAIIVDKNGAPAVDNLGVFTAGAVDLWSAASSGNASAVSKGGVAELIDPNNRLAYTDLACSSYPCLFLNSDENRLHPSNDESNGGLITNEILGLDDNESEDVRIKMLNYIRGKQWNSETRVYDSLPRMGDMLHTEPLVVTYSEDYASNPSSNGQVIYATTNEGYLHAFNTVTGKEIFAFMPSSLMKNIPVQYYNSDTGNHAYGIDGNMSKRIILDPDGKIERVLLYFGLRRGGRAYYALDVTKPAQPKLLWKIDSKVVIPSNTKKEPRSVNNDRCKKNAENKSRCSTDSLPGQGDFARLGQTWSTPYLAKIRTGDTEFREVVIFSGGFDINQDEEDQDVRESTDAVGNEIFIVDGEDGALLWSAHSGGTLGGGISNASKLTHSIPGGMRILDMNQDGAVDRIYFADMGGQVWRLELPMGPSYNLSDSKLIHFADLGGNNFNNRMFFNEPDVGLLKSNGRNWLTVSLGSGYRAHPANGDIQDNFYVLLDGAVNTPLQKNIDNTENFTTLDHGDLIKVTATGDQTISSINQGDLTDKTILDVDGKAGWYMEMPRKGEKILATSITAEGNVMFTSLVPDLGSSNNAGVIDLCSAPLTQGRFYSMNILTAESGSDVNGDGTVTDSDVMTVVTANEIPGTPQRVFKKPTCKDKECTQLVDVRVGKRKEALMSYDASLLESVFWTNPERK